MPICIIFGSKYTQNTLYLEKNMSEYTTRAEKLSLPLIALDCTVAFPGEIVNLEIKDSRFSSCDAAREAFEGSKYAIAIPYKYEDDENSELFEIGTVIKVKQLINAGDKTVRCIAEGVSRASITDYRRTGRYFTANVICKTVTLSDDPSVKNQAYLLRLNEAASAMAKLLPPPAENIIPNFKNIKKVLAIHLKLC